MRIVIAFEVLLGLVGSESIRLLAENKTVNQSTGNLVNKTVNQSLALSVQAAIATTNQTLTYETNAKTSECTWQRKDQVCGFKTPSFTAYSTSEVSTLDACKKKAEGSDDQGIVWYKHECSDEKRCWSIGNDAPSPQGNARCAFFKSDDDCNWGEVATPDDFETWSKSNCPTSKCPINPFFWICMMKKMLGGGGFPPAGGR
eukprot:gnl/TRDRNA2_/TRDRNA2_201014_c0_seq1.p1 gnl/TRDRNA2_/TRDRNA2_201014_c0~~gnl/TRDRNA2_/TRDRNA2_201014_c0_seq1.p1  ORF type:complete len:201 (-),score=21.56 gnl/TRDRNA2_/TRDRNA2_201014_c0_seq1:159-761(-)